MARLLISSVIRIPVLSNISALTNVFIITFVFFSTRCLHSEDEFLLPQNCSKKLTPVEDRFFVVVVLESHHEWRPTTHLVSYQLYYNHI